MSVCDRLEEVLHREKIAITQLDGPALAGLETEKNALLQELYDLPASAKENLGKRLPILLASAQINAMLLADAVDTMAELFGLTQSGVYDKTAKRDQPSRVSRKRVA